MAKKGRPSSFSETIAETICVELSEGRSLRSICTDEGMPDKATVFRWLATNEAFRDQYARAREAQADAMADETLDIADDGSNDWMERRNADGALIGWQLNGEAVSRSKLRVDARKWFAAKLAPKKYGERQQLDVDARVEVRTLDQELAALNGTYGNAKSDSQVA